jgi:hypothetical protein
MARRSDRHGIRPIAALAFNAGTTIGPPCATIHDGQEDENVLPLFTGRIYDRTGFDDHQVNGHLLDNREESIYGLLGLECGRYARGTRGSVFDG